MSKTITTRIAKLSAVLAVAALALAGTGVRAVDVNWNGGNTDWTNPDSDSFSGGTYSDGYDVHFASMNPAIVNVTAGGVAPNSMQFDSTNGGYTFNGGDITGGSAGVAFMDYEKDYTTTFNGGDGSGNYNFAGDVTVRHGGAHLKYQPGTAGAYNFGTGTIKLGTPPAGNYGGNGGGQFSFSYAPGVTLTNNIEIGTFGGTIQKGSGFTGNITLDGTLSLGGGNTITVDGNVILNGANRTVNVNGYSTFAPTTLTCAGGSFDLILNHNGGNPDHISYIGGPGGWDIANFIRGGNANPNLVFTTDPNTIFSGVVSNGGKVSMNTGGVYFGSTTPTINFALDMNNDSGFANTTTLINVGAGGTLAGNGTIAGRNGLGGVAGFPNAVGVAVANGGTLAGDLTITGTVTAANGATISPGNSLGTITMNSNLSLNETTQLVIDVEPGGASDLIQVDGDLILDGVVQLTGTPVLGEWYTFLSWDGTLTDNGLVGGTLPFGIQKFIVDVGAGTIQTMWIPEPGTMILASLGGLLMLRRRRSR